MRPVPNASSPLRIVSTNDAELGASFVARARAGERAAMQYVYDAHASYVVGMCARLMRDRERGMDAAQEAFVTAFEKLRDLRDDSAFRPWIAQIAVRICRSQLQRDRMFRVVGWGKDQDPGADATSTLADGSASPETASDLRQANAVLRSLPTHARVAWTLKHLQDEPLVRIATLTGRSLASVKRDVEHAEHELARQMGAAP